MTAGSPSHSAAQAGASRAAQLRVWLGVAIAALAAWFALRGVDFAALWAEFGRARWGVLLGVSIPSYVAVVLLRALRWRHLTDAIQPMSRAVLFRAVAVGYMANNLFPLRIGELVRVGTLARDTGAPAAAVLGTVVVERVIDGLCVLGMGLGVVVLWGGETQTWQRAVLWFAPVALLPLVVLVGLRVAPERVVALAAWVLRLAPARASEWVLRQLRSFASGLGALRGGAHLAWIALHSVGIWLVASTLPILAGFWALDVHLGSPGRTLAAAWMTLAALGVAVALPAAPGFFGLYHSACRLVLQQFGVSAETAVAIGTLCHAVFFVTLIALGLVVLRGGGSRLGALRESVSPTRSSAES